MDKPKRYIGVGTFHTTDAIRHNIKTVLDTERISYGPFCREFESRFSTIHNNKFGVLSNSGTSSLHVALQTLKELHDYRWNDRVIVPASTFVATVNVVLHNDMLPYLVDVEEDSWAMDPAKLQDALNAVPATRCVMPVHPFGQSADMRSITQLTGDHIHIVEDSCETMFCQHHNRMVGSWGDISCYSMYIAHLITTGVGGIACTNNADYAIKMRSLVNHGRDNIYISPDDNNVSPDRLKEVIGRRFNFTSIGHSYRITELEAAIGMAQLETYPLMMSRRNQNANFLVNNLERYDDRLRTLKIRSHTTQSWMMFPILCVRDEKREMCEFLESNGVETRDCLPLTNQPAYKGMFCEDDYPVSKKLNRHGFYIGCHQDLTQDDLDYVVSVFNDYFERAR